MGAVESCALGKLVRTSIWYNPVTRRFGSVGPGRHQCGNYAC